MASLVIAMQLRQIFYQIDARLKRHRNYRRIIAVLDQQCVLCVGVLIKREFSLCCHRLCPRTHA